jgi:hypothetical protein
MRNIFHIWEQKRENDKGRGEEEEEEEEEEEWLCESAYLFTLLFGENTNLNEFVIGSPTDTLLLFLRLSTFTTLNKIQ